MQGAALLVHLGRTQKRTRHPARAKVARLGLQIPMQIRGLSARRAHRVPLQQICSRSYTD